MISQQFTQNEYPPIFIKILIDGQLKLIGKIKAIDYVYVQNENIRGALCGIRQELLLKVIVFINFTHSLLKSDIQDYILYAFSLDGFMYSQL